MAKPHSFSEILQDAVNWRTYPAIIQRESGECWCGQSIQTHDERVHMARWMERHSERGETQ